MGPAKDGAKAPVFLRCPRPARPAQKRSDRLLKACGHTAYVVRRSSRGWFRPAGGRVAALEPERPGGTNRRRVGRGRRHGQDRTLRCGRPADAARMASKQPQHQKHPTICIRSSRSLLLPPVALIVPQLWARFKWILRTAGPRSFSQIACYRSRPGGLFIIRPVHSAREQEIAIRLKINRPAGRLYRGRKL